MSKYISLENLERYDAKMQEHFASFCASKQDGMWRQTEKAGAVSFWPVGNSPLEGTVEFMFKETPPASGEKSPTNPSTIAGVSNIGITRCGKNLFPQKPDTPTTYRGVTFEYDPSDGGIFIHGTADSDKNPLIDVINIGYGNSPAPFVKGKTYSFYLDCQDSNISIQLYDKTTDTISGNSSASGTQFVYTIDNNNRSLIFRLSVTRGVTVNTKAYIHIEEANELKPFEKPECNKYTITLGGTYYGGSIDLATGLMTVTWWGESLSMFTEVASINTSTVAFNYYSVKGHEGDVNPISRFLSCDKFQVLNGTNDVEHCRFGGNPGGSRRVIRFWIDKSRLDVSGAVNPSSPTNAEWVAAANAWLASNPVFVCYKLFTPETLPLTPTQILSLPQPDKYVPRLNTVYSDADAVQIVYQKNPVRDKFEKVQAIIAQGGNV